MLYAAVAEHVGKEDYKEGITYPQFLNAFTTDLTGCQNRDRVAELFKIVNEDSGTSIRLEDLRRLVKDIGESVTIDELKTMIRNVTGNNDEIPFEVFHALVKKPTA